MNPRIVIDERTGCWNWQGALTSAGYPEVQINGRISYTYRYMYFLWYGDWPHTLHHTCGNSICCNPEHLMPFNSQAEHLVYQNTGRAYRLKTACINGHDLTGKENVYVSPKGVRQCRLCAKMRVQKYNERAKARRE